MATEVSSSDHNIQLIEHTYALHRMYLISLYAELFNYYEIIKQNISNK